MKKFLKKSVKVFKSLVWLYLAVLVVVNLYGLLYTMIINYSMSERERDLYHDVSIVTVLGDKYTIDKSPINKDVFVLNDGVVINSKNVVSITKGDKVKPSEPKIFVPTLNLFSKL